MAVCVFTEAQHPLSNHTPCPLCIIMLLSSVLLNYLQMTIISLITIISETIYRPTKDSYLQSFSDMSFVQLNITKQNQHLSIVFRCSAHPQWITMTDEWMHACMTCKVKDSILQQKQTFQAAHVQKNASASFWETYLS